MPDGDHLHAIRGDLLNDLEREPAEEISASAMHEQRPAFRGFGDGFDSVIEFSEK